MSMSMIHAQKPRRPLSLLDARRSGGLPFLKNPFRGIRRPAAAALTHSESHPSTNSRHFAARQATAAI
jgi:hypothetical protein